MCKSNTCECSGGRGWGGCGGGRRGQIVPEELAHSVRLLSAQPRCQGSLIPFNIPLQECRLNSIIIEVLKICFINTWKPWRSGSLDLRPWRDQREWNAFSFRQHNYLVRVLELCWEKKKIIKKPQSMKQKRHIKKPNLQPAIMIKKIEVPKKIQSP